VLCIALFPFNLKKYEKKVHNMFFLMLDPRFNFFCFLFSVVMNKVILLLRSMTKNHYILCL
jgi:hypothetical protein